MPVEQNRLTRVHRAGRRGNPFPDFSAFSEGSKGSYIPGERRQFSGQELILRSIDTFPRHVFSAIQTESVEKGLGLNEYVSSLLYPTVFALESQETPKQDVILEDVGESSRERVSAEQEMLAQGQSRDELYVPHGIWVPKRINQIILGYANRIVELTRNARFKANDFIIEVLR